MRTGKTLLWLVVGSGLISLSGTASAMQTGFGYGLDTRSSTSLEQYELVVRQALSYTAQLGDIFEVSTAVEYGAALIHYKGPDDAVTGRFSAMPMVILSPHKNINIYGGVGAGFMVGQTKFGDHDLSGPFLFNGKLGLQSLLGESWGIEYTFYHQSNAHLYDNNDSLNMHQLAVSYRF